MRIEKTPTYIRLFLPWGHYLTIITLGKKRRRERRSTKTVCRMIGLTERLTTADVVQMRDYFTAILEHREKCS